MSRRIVAPDELAPLVHHSFEKVLVFASGPKFRPEYLLDAVQYPSPQQYVTGAGLLPSQNETRLMPWPVVESGLHEPFRGLGLEIREHGRQHTIYPLRFERP